MLSLPRDNFRSPSALAAFFLTVILGLTLDLWSKNYSFDRLAEYRGTRVVDSRVYPFIPGWLEFTVTTNQGAVFGYVRDMIHALPRWPKLFPWIFNVADVMLCTGVGLMVLYSLLHSGREPHNIGEDERKP